MLPDFLDFFWTLTIASSFLDLFVLCWTAHLFLTLTLLHSRKLVYPFVLLLINTIKRNLLWRVFCIWVQNPGCTVSNPNPDDITMNSSAVIFSNLTKFLQSHRKLYTSVFTTLWFPFNIKQIFKTTCHDFISPSRTIKQQQTDSREQSGTSFDPREEFRPQKTDQVKVL